MINARAGVAARGDQFRAGQLALSGLLGAIVAAVANLIVFAVAKGLLDVSFVMPYEGPSSTPKSLPAPYVAVSSAIGAIAAAGFLAVLARFVTHPLRIFQIAAAVLTAFSLIGPLTLADTSSGTKAGLMVMHLVAGAVITAIFTLRMREAG